MHIVGGGVDNYYPADDVLRGEAVGDECHMRPVCHGIFRRIGIERGHISAVAGMGTIPFVIVASGVFKGVCGVSCAGASAVDMYGKYAAFAFALFTGQTVYGNGDHCPEIGCHKGGTAVYAGVCLRAFYNGFGGRGFLHGTSPLNDFLQVIRTDIAEFIRNTHYHMPPIRVMLMTGQR